MGTGQQTTRLHSYAHVNERCYRAVRLALFPAGFPTEREWDGRFISRTKATARRLRRELASTNNIPLEEAVERTRETGR